MFWTYHQFLAPSVELGRSKICSSFVRCNYRNSRRLINWYTAKVQGHQMDSLKGKTTSGYIIHVYKLRYIQNLIRKQGCGAFPNTGFVVTYILIFHIFHKLIIRDKIWRSGKMPANFDI